MKVEEELATLLPTGSIEFREDVDLLEQVNLLTHFLEASDNRPK